MEASDAAVEGHPIEKETSVGGRRGDSLVQILERWLDAIEQRRAHVR